MSKFFLYGGILGAVASAAIIGVLLFQMNGMSNQIDELNVELGTAKTTIELQEETIIEQIRQSEIISENIKQFNREVQDIGRQERPKISSSPDSKELSNSINNIFQRFNEVSR